MRSYIGKMQFPHRIRLSKALKSIFGFGVTHEKVIFRRLGIKTKVLLADIEESTIKSISNLVFKHSTLDDLYRYRRKILQYELNVGTYRGIRMRQGLPRNGQRTHTNAGTPRRFISKKLF